VVIVKVFRVFQVSRHEDRRRGQDNALAAFVHPGWGLADSLLFAISNSGSAAGRVPLRSLDTKRTTHRPRNDKRCRFACSPSVQVIRVLDELLSSWALSLQCRRGTLNDCS
jgi:hypothetical protein